MELKRIAIFTRVLNSSSFNRTIMELKPAITANMCRVKLPFNRTIMELKLEKSLA